MITAKINKMATIKNTVFRKIKEDFELRDKLIAHTGLRDSAIISWAHRESHRMVGQYEIVNLIKEHTGWTDEEIFETAE